MRKLFLGCALSLFAAQSLPAYVLEGQSWTRDRTVQMQLSLGAPRLLSDGFRSMNASAADALNIWNGYLAHMTFQPVLASPVTPASGDYENSAAFSNTVFGDAFGKNVLAVTTIDSRNNITSETDTLFNTAYQWDSYDGPLRPDVIDFHRVALHEFGHVLGLDHPDTAGQHVSAIMNSEVSNVYRLQPDDIAGARAIYNTGPAYQNAVDAPVLANISTRALVGNGDDVLIGGFIIQGNEPATVIVRAIGYSLRTQGITNPLTDPLITVYDSNQREIARNDDWFTGATPQEIASYHLDPPNSIESALLLSLQPGEYTAIVSGFVNADENTPPGIGLFELYDLHTTGGRAGNLSTRGQVGLGENVLIGGFIIGGDVAKPIILRALGPSLGAAGVTDPLADPSVELHDGNGNLLQSNNDWGTGPDAGEISREGFAPKNAKESALSATLNPGAYTAIVRGEDSSTGVGLVEVYDLSEVPQ